MKNFPTSQSEQSPPPRPAAKILFASLLILVAALIGWQVLDRDTSSPASGEGERRVLFYQSPMHPWVKADKPGRCTVCGMDLVPVYEGGKTPGEAASDIVMLPEGSPAIMNVRTAEVKRQPLIRTLRVAGIIEDDDSRHRILSAYAGGRIEKLLVNYEGAEVEEGQPLATFYSKELLNAANNYKVIAKQENTALLSAAESRLLQMGLLPEQIAGIPQRADHDVFFEILAPRTGTVVNRYVYEGQYVVEGEKLFELADFSTMWFQFIAYEQDLPFLREGLPVIITTPSLPGRSISSVIKFINPNLDGMTRSARVRVEFQNPTSERGLHRRHEVLHKLYADAKVTLEAPEVIAVPRQAVLWTGTNARVYVAQGERAYQQREVILGRPGDEVWEVLEGVQPGERVVASGNMLIDGQAQLNNLAAPEEISPPLVDLAAGMNAEQHAALEKFLGAIAAVTDALAADDLAGYQTARGAIPPPPEGLVVPAPAPTADLAAARREFLPISQQVAEYARQVRGHFPKLKIFRCPMSDQLGRGAPENAKWIQFTPELRNPYMGQEMISCGTEVK